MVLQNLKSEMLKPLDLYVLVALLALPPREGWTQAAFAQLLGVLQPALTRSLQRLAEAGLWDREARQVDIAGAEGLLVHAARFIVPPRLGPPARGLPTAHAVPPLAEELGGGDVLVWPDDEGSAVGTALTPLSPSAPRAARREPALHAMLSLVDGLRVGRARERAVAARLLHERIVGATR